MSKGPLVTDGDLSEAASATAFAADAIERHMSGEMYRNAVTAVLVFFAGSDFGF